MKRIIIAILMLIFAVSVSTVSAYFFDKRITELGNSIEKIYNQPNKENISKIIYEWKSAKLFLKFVTVHETVNEIEICFASLEDSDSDDSVREVCSEIKTLLKILDESEKASPENIF